MQEPWTPPVEQCGLHEAPLTAHYVPRRVHCYSLLQEISEGNKKLPYFPNKGQRKLPRFFRLPKCQGVGRKKKSVCLKTIIYGSHVARNVRGKIICPVGLRIACMNCGQVDISKPAHDAECIFSKFAESDIGTQSSRIIQSGSKINDHYL